MSEIPTEPCPERLVKVLALAMFYGIRVFKRQPSDDFNILLKYQSRGWNVPAGKYDNFGTPRHSTVKPRPIDIGPDGPTLDQWLLIFRAMERGGGWEWDNTHTPKHVICEWELPCE